VVVGALAISQKKCIWHGLCVSVTQRPSVTGRCAKPDHREPKYETDALFREYHVVCNAPSRVHWNFDRRYPPCRGATRSRRRCRERALADARVYGPPVVHSCKDVGRKARQSESDNRYARSSAAVGPINLAGRCSSLTRRSRRQFAGRSTSVRIPRDPRVGSAALKHRWGARRSRLYGRGGQSHHLIADCPIANCRRPLFVCKRMVAANIEAEADLLLLIAAVSKAG
jgi:hypothetical protein